MNRTPLLLLMCILLLSLECLTAQTASEGIYPFVKRSSGNGVSITYTGQPDNVKYVLETWMTEASGERSFNRNGFRALEAVRIQEFSPATYDYYLKVEKLSRQDKEHTEVVLFVSAGNDNFLSSNTHPEMIRQMSLWLESMQRAVTMYELELAIEAQQKVIEKEQRLYDRLQQDSVRLQTDLTETLEDIEKNKATNTTQRQTIASEKLQLQAFREELATVREGTGREETTTRSDDSSEAAASQDAGTQQAEQIQEEPSSGGDG